MKWWVAAITCASLAAVAGGAAQDPEPPKVGDRAPEFSLPGSDGKTHELKEYVGKKAVVIAWYPAAFTGG